MFYKKLLIILGLTSYFLTPLSANYAYCFTTKYDDWGTHEFISGVFYAGKKEGWQLNKEARAFASYADAWSQSPKCWSFTSKRDAKTERRNQIKSGKRIVSNNPKYEYKI